ncbi:MAG: hypothetical protein D6733_02355 [Methanobacteriota archaeon]|nr:MAG: hypothetical protein D6733_02355 [Euryarchaeota archaeon]
MLNTDKIYLFWYFSGSVTLGFFVYLWAVYTGRRSTLWGCGISLMWYLVLDGFGLAWEFLFLPSMIVPVLISYVYHKSGAVNFTLDGYIVSAFFGIAAVFQGILIGYIFAIAGISGYVPY